jgi:hypothetical protein
MLFSMVKCGILKSNPKIIGSGNGLLETIDKNIKEKQNPK